MAHHGATPPQAGLPVGTRRHSEIARNHRPIAGWIGNRTHRAERPILQQLANCQQRLQLARGLIEQIDRARLGIARCDHQQLAFIRARPDNVDNRLIGQRFGQPLGKLGKIGIEIGNFALFSRVAGADHPSLPPNADQRIRVHIIARQQNLARAAAIKREFCNRVVAVLGQVTLGDIAPAIDRHRHE